MARTIKALTGVRGLVLPGGWVLDAGDQVIVPDEEWTEIRSDPATSPFLDDLGFTSALPDPVPTFRDIQRAASGASGGSGSEVAAALGEHIADTTSVHGIPNTALLETSIGAQAKVDAHAADTTSVHGITDTSRLAWNQQVDTDVLTAPEGTVLTRVGGQWAPAAPTGGSTVTPYEATVNFAVASDVWEHVHGQGTYAVHVEAFDTNDNPIEGTELYPNANTVRIEWFYPQTGYLRIWTLT